MNWPSSPANFGRLIPSGFGRPIVAVTFSVQRLTTYVSPTILLSGMIMVVLFSRLKIKGNIISMLSPLAFGIYLFQLNQVVWNKIIFNAFNFVASMNVVIGIVYVLGFALIIFAVGLIVELMRSELSKKLKIYTLSNKIVKIANKFIELTFDFIQ